MPLPVAKVHERFKSEFFSQLDDGEHTVDFGYAQVWECNSGQEVDDNCQMHPWLDGEDPSFLTQFLMDQKTTRWYYIAIGLWDRIGIGDIDDDGEIISGEYEKLPVIFFSECSENWAKEKLKINKANADKAIRRGAMGGIKEEAYDGIMEQRAKIIENKLKKGK